MVRWPIHSPKGEIILRFNETSVDVSSKGELNGNWLLELSSDKNAKLPFRKIDPGNLSCTYKNAPYSVLAKAGTFTNGPDSDLRIVPGDNRIVLDFSSRQK